MELLLLFAVIFIVVGVILLLAGHLVPSVTPGAINAGWGLIVLGVLLLVIVLVVGAVGDVDLDEGGDRADAKSWG